MSPAAYVAVGAVRAYQWTLRPLIGANCRFWPSCSEYAVDAFRAHGAVRGAALAGWRILRCNPWCTAGYDPVPPAGRLWCSAVPSQTDMPTPTLDAARDDRLARDRAPEAGSGGRPSDPAMQTFPGARAAGWQDDGKSL